MFKYGTKINSANSTSKSMRTSVPKEIAKLLELEIGDTMEWNVEVINPNEYKIFVTKKADE